MLTARIFVLMILGMIAWQDARSRSVYWFCFPALIMAFIYIKVYDGNGRLWADLLLNLSVVFIKLSVLTIVLSFRRRRIVRVWEGMLGTGDILFFIAISFYLSLLNFVVFDVVSLVITALVWRIYNIYFKHLCDSIPLAGIQSILLILLLICDWWWLHFGTATDGWLLEPLLLWNPLKLY